MLWQPTFGAIHGYAGVDFFHFRHACWVLHPLPANRNVVPSIRFRCFFVPTTGQVAISRVEPKVTHATAINSSSDGRHSQGGSSHLSVPCRTQPLALSAMHMTSLRIFGVGVTLLAKLLPQKNRFFDPDLFVCVFEKSYPATEGNRA